MKKTIIIILLLFSTSLFVHAQNKEIEAIAAYQMAEEHFEKKEYAEAIKSLRNAKEILGTANSKMLYLEVLALQGLCDEDTESGYYLNKMQQAIVDFEKAPDIDQFSQEKRVEVAKIKMTIPNRQKVIKDAADLKLLKEQLEEQLELLKEQTINSFFESFPKLGMSVDEFIKLPYWRGYLNKSWRKYLMAGNAESYTRGEFKDDVENDRYISSFKTDASGNVKEYNTHVEVSHTDYKKAVAELFGITNLEILSTYDNGAYSLRGSDKWIYVAEGIKTSSSKYRRKRGKVNVNYLSVYVEYL